MTWVMPKSFESGPVGVHRNNSLSTLSGTTQPPSSEPVELSCVAGFQPPCSSFLAVGLGKLLNLCACSPAVKLGFGLFLSLHFFCDVKCSSVITVTATNRFGNKQLTPDKQPTELLEPKCKDELETSPLAGSIRQAKGISQGVLQKEMRSIR